MKKLTLTALILNAIVLPNTLFASGPPLLEAQKLIASDSSQNGFFGSTIETQAEFAFIGTFRKEAVYVFEQVNEVWSEVQRITPNLVSSGSLFGYSITVDGTWMAVGSPYLDQSSNFRDVGTVHMFEFDGTQWIQTQQISAPIPNFRGGGGQTRGENFGHSLDIQGNTMVVGAPNLSNNVSGVVYIFQFDGTDWSLSNQLSASDTSAKNFFGWQTTFNNSQIIVAANLGAGAVYTYDFDGMDWLETQKITPIDPPTADFGNAIDVNQDTLVIAASRDNSVESNGGAVYVYQWDTVNGWVRTQELFAKAPINSERFGLNLSLSGNNLLITTRNDRAFLFKHYNNSWKLSKTLIPSEDATDDFFGTGVSVTADDILIGSTKSEVGLDPDHGAVFTFINDLIFNDGFEK